MNDMTRRDWLRLSGLGAASMALPVALPVVASTVKPDLTVPSVPLGVNQDLCLDEKILEHLVGEAKRRWYGTHLLDNISNYDDRGVMALTMDNQRLFNEIASKGMTPEIQRISIPIVRRALGLIIREGWLPLYPTAGPMGMVYYHDFRPDWMIRTSVSFASRRATPCRKSGQLGHTAEPVACGSYVYGEFWTPLPYGADGRYNGRHQNALDEECEKLEDVAKDLAESVMKRAARNIFSTSFSSTRDTTCLTQCLLSRDDIQSQIQPPGHFWALVPPGVEFDQLSEQLSENEIRVSRRGVTPLTLRKVALIGYRGEQRSNNGYLSVPYIPVTKTETGFKARWGEKHGRKDWDSSKFFRHVWLS